MEHRERRLVHAELPRIGVKGDFALDERVEIAGEGPEKPEDQKKMDIVLDESPVAEVPVNENVLMFDDIDPGPLEGLVQPEYQLLDGPGLDLSPAAIALVGHRRFPVDGRP